MKTRNEALDTPNTPTATITLKPAAGSNLTNDEVQGGTPFLEVCNTLADLRKQSILMIHKTQTSYEVAVKCNNTASSRTFIRGFPNKSFDTPKSPTAPPGLWSVF